MILVTGANGQLGFDVVKELKNRKIEYVAVTRSNFDIADYKEVEAFILKVKPQCIIHCAAYTAVDNAEEEKDLCYSVNVIGTENVAKACKKINSKMIYISSDYVFNGKGNIPYEVNDIADSISVYGKSKYEGEIKVKEILNKYFIVRTSWVFGINGNNFVKTMLKLGKGKEVLNVVCDQIGSPTYTKDLVILLCDMSETEKYGTYHATNEGFCSWAEFAEAIMEIANLKCKINHIKTSEYNSKADRPLNSRLSKKGLVERGFKVLPTWENALERFVGEVIEKPNL